MTRLSRRAALFSLAALALAGCAGDVAEHSTLAFLGKWFIAFLLTQSVEMGIYANAPGGPPRPLRERIAVAFGASAITHPMVWFVISTSVPLLLADTGYSFRTRWWIGVACAEAFAVVVEALWLIAFRHRAFPAFVTSLGANALSFTLGLFVYERMGW